MTGKTPEVYALEVLAEHDRLSGERYRAFEAQLTRIEAHTKALTARVIGMDRTLNEVAELLQDFAAAMAAAAEEEEPLPAPADQGSILAEAISKLAGEQDQEDELEFPAWGAPKKQKGK